MELLYRIGTYSTRRDTTSRNVNNILKSTHYCVEYSYLSNRRVYQLSMQGDIFEKKS